MKTSGQLSSQVAQLSLQLSDTQDCQEREFCCVAISEDEEGRTSATKSLKGRAIDSQSEAKPTSVRAGQAGVGETLAQLVDLFTTRFDLGSRMDKAIESLETGGQR